MRLIPDKYEYAYRIYCAEYGVDNCDIFHFFRALEKPDREERVADHCSEAIDIDELVSSEPGDKMY
jgi:hypothetical protein